MQTQHVFLEEWLRTSGATHRSSSPPPSHSPPASARAILQAWADLRDYQAQTSPQGDHLLLLIPLQTLLNSSSSLHVADPQAKLLLSILSSSPPPHSQPLLFRLLYTWLRKSARPSPALLESAAKLLSSPTASPSQGILLLGALSFSPSLSETSRRACLDLLCRLLEEGRGPEEFVPEVLAGIGYALVRSDGVYFCRILAYLLGGIWKMEGGPRATLPHGLMILSLVEWVVLAFINSRSLEKVELICGEVSARKLEAGGNYARFAVVMASAGVLRAFRTVASSSIRFELNPRLRNSLEGSIAAVAAYLVSRVGSNCNLDGDFESHLILQCISLGLARSGPFSFAGPVLLCVCLALLHEIFPLQRFFGRVLENADANATNLSLSEVKEHLDCVLFMEAGAVTGVLCNLYALADEENKRFVENCIWGYSQELYSKLRMVSLVLRGQRNELLGELEKVAEGVFLMVVVFAAEATKQKSNPTSSREIQQEFSVRVLIAFSCIEYLRRVRWPGYSNAIRHAILTVQENASACTTFIESMPSYAELTNQQGCLKGMNYFWSQDDVQTARILFYLRVIPTCIGHIASPIFGKIAAPTMFLYMCHPNEKVARASHSVFVAFVSSGKDSNEDDRVLLKEQLVFYYMQRSLEAYPGVTPFEGMASGVAVLVRCLPAGSPAIFYCIHSLVRKATDICSKAMNQDTDLWKTWQGDLEPCKKVIELLLRLISLVDIQVLPNLLKSLAQFIVQLPKEGQNSVLDEIYSVVAESDDVIRKPTLVSWLQSLSYLSSQTMFHGSKKNIQPSSVSTSKGSIVEVKTDAVQGGDILSLNRTHSRL